MRHKLNQFMMQNITKHDFTACKQIPEILIFIKVKSYFPEFVFPIEQFKERKMLFILSCKIKARLKFAYFEYEELNLHCRCGRLSP